MNKLMKWMGHCASRLLAVNCRQERQLSRNDAVGMGSVGRRPAVFGGPPNTLVPPSLTHHSGLRKSMVSSFRRASENSLRAAGAPLDVESFRLSAGRYNHLVFCASLALSATFALMTSPTGNAQSLPKLEASLKDGKPLVQVHTRNAQGTVTLYQSVNLRQWTPAAPAQVITSSRLVQFLLTGVTPSPAIFFRATEQSGLNLEYMISIQPGAFTLGSPAGEAGRFEDEGPQTQVTFTKAFYVRQFEITQSEFEEVMGSNPSFFKGDPDRPVEMVTYAEAVDYCTKLTQSHRLAGSIPATHAYRLPTEAEWECAARAGTTTRFSFGNDESLLGNYAWISANSGNTTHPGAQKQANPWQLYDICGNVYEWCADWYGPYPGGSVTNPKGPASGSYRVIRGGAFMNNAARLCRSALRGNLDPNSRSMFVGFRPVLAETP